MRRFGSRLGVLLKDEKGAVLFLVAVLMVLLLGMTAMVVDVGALYQAKRGMVNAADASALAGAQQLHLKLSGQLDDDIKSYTESYAINNYNCDEATAEVRGLEVEVLVEKNVELYFARFLGFLDSDVRARAVAKIGKTKDGNIIPIGIHEDLFHNIPLNEEEDIVYFDNNPFGAGNWSWIYFEKTETPATTVGFVEDGYDASINDPVWTNTGANIPVGDRKTTLENILDYYIEHEVELWVPIIRYEGDLPEQGKKEAKIVGFGVIILTGYDFDNPKEQSISGYFIRGILSEEDMLSSGDYSTLYPSGVALIE